MADDGFALKWDEKSLRALDRMLTELPAKVAANEVGKASNKAMKQMEKVARALVPREHGTLRKAIGRRQKKYGSQGNVYTIVGPRTGFKDPVTGENPVNIAHLVEFGTRPHLIAPKGQSGALKIKRGVGPQAYVEGAVQHPGATAKHFLRSAFDETKAGVLSTLGRELAIGIEKQADKLKWSTK